MANKIWVGTDSGNEGNWATAANWSPSGAPGAGDDVRLVAENTQAIIGTLDQSAVALGDFIVEDGYSGTIGTSAADLQLDPNRFEFAGSGVAYIDVSGAAISALITKTASAPVGKRGLYIKGSAIATLTVQNGTVGVATIHSTTATVTTAVASGSGADLWIGEGVTLTNLYVNDGTVSLRSAATTINMFGGTLLTEEVGAITTINQYAGMSTLSSIGTITTLNHNGGIADLSQIGLARTVTTYSPQKGATLIDNPIVTITTHNRTTAAARVTYS